MVSTFLIFGEGHPLDEFSTILQYTITFDELNLDEDLTVIVKEPGVVTVSKVRVVGGVYSSFLSSILL